MIVRHSLCLLWLFSEDRLNPKWNSTCATLKEHVNWKTTHFLSWLVRSTLAVGFLIHFIVNFHRAILAIPDIKRWIKNRLPFWEKDIFRENILRWHFRLLELSYCIEALKKQRNNNHLQRKISLRSTRQNKSKTRCSTPKRSISTEFLLHCVCGTLCPLFVLYSWVRRPFRQEPTSPNKLFTSIFLTLKS